MTQSTKTDRPKTNSTADMTPKPDPEVLPKPSFMYLVSFACSLQREYEFRTTPDSRKRKGQVFTPAAVCRYLAGLFSEIPENFRLLDPGAGAGALTAAFCDRVLRLRSRRRLAVHLFENDVEVVELLDTTMRRCRMALADAGHSLTYKIHEADFVLASEPSVPI